MVPLTGCVAYQNFQNGLQANQNVFQRQQNLLDEQNLIAKNELVSRQTQQLIQQAKYQAQIKIEEAKGLAAAQRIIDGTLTDRYLQHEAIQAQLEAAKNSSHTETIYVPSTVQGIPNVFNVGNH